jgi:hypothetical protein
VRGNRIQSIVNELQGEKIDVVAWDSDVKVFIAKALSPSEVVDVEFSDDNQTATVVVPDRQLSLAIGKEGQNTRLAARLTGYRLDIKGMTEWEEIREERLKQRALAQEQQAVAEAEEAPAPELEPSTATLATDVETPAEEVMTEDEPTAEVAAQAVEVAPDTGSQAVDGLDEDQLLEALIQEEEQADTEVGEADQSAGLSVEELQAFTLEDVEPLENDEDEDEDEEDVLPELPDLSVLAPDAGKIRFAEDLVEDVRGGRRDRRGRRGGGARGGARGGR